MQVVAGKVHGAQPELPQRCGRDVKPSVRGQPLAPADPAPGEIVRNLTESHTFLRHGSYHGCAPSGDRIPLPTAKNLPEALSQTLPLGEALNFSALQMHSGSQPSSSEMLRSITHQEAAILPPLPTLPLVSVSLHSCLFGPPSAAGEE